MKIKLKPFKDIKYEVWSESEGFIGLASELQIYDVRIQCLMNKVTDVYIKFEDKKIYITESGDFSSFPKGFLDHLQKFLMLTIKLKGLTLDEKHDYRLTEAIEKYNDYCQKYLI